MILNAVRSATGDMLGKLGPTFWLILASITLICFLSGPFGTFDVLPSGIRLIYWALQVGTTGLAGLWLQSLIRTQGWTSFGQLSCVSLLFGFAVFGLVVLFSMALLGPIGKYPGHLSLFINSYPTATLIFLVLALLNKDPAVETSVETSQRPKLFDRLTDHQSAQHLVSLSAQDHYVEVHTDAGSELCLIRLADAIAEAEPQQGIQIHRSHWVARSAFDKLEPDGAATLARLKDGRTLTISQSRLSKVRKYLASG